MNRLPGLVLAACAGLLTACSDEPADLRAWMDAQRQQAPASAPPLQAAPDAAPVAYAGPSQADPFDPLRLQPGAELGRAFMPPDPRHTLPVLERNPLEAMAMVGTLEQAGRRMALIRVEGGLFTVAVGSRMGVHGGVVNAITETEVRVREPVRDALGRTAQRASILTLTEGRS